MAKRGRPRNPNAKRTPHGRISRVHEAYDAHKGPIEARMQRFGLTRQDAGQPDAETFIGRLWLTRRISGPQYDAAKRYLEIRAAYLKAIKAPQSLRTGAVAGVEREDYTDWYQRARQRYAEAEKAVSVEQAIYRNRGRNLFGALNYVVCRDLELWHLVGDTRIALNALAHHFGFVRNGKRVPASPPADSPPDKLGSVAPSGEPAGETSKPGEPVPSGAR